MPLFKYRALTEEGKNIAGVIDADSYLMAKDKLHKMEILITHLVPFEKKRNEIVLTPPLLLAFTRELHQLLHAGLPLYESLLTIEEKYRKHQAHSLFLDLCDQLKGGASLSVSLARYPKSFNRIYLAMIGAAEQSGALENALDELTQLITRQQKLKKQLFSALAYPSFLALFCGVVLLSLLVFVIPSMKELFEGRALHPLTSCVLQASHLVTEYGAYFFYMLVLLSIGFYFLCKDARVKVGIQKILIKIPLFKNLVLQAALVRFCRSVSILLASGVPLMETLALSKKLMKNPLLEMAVENAEKGVVEGRKLSDEFKKSPHIPSLMVRMLSIAEETGNLSLMMQNIAEIYDENLEKDLTQLTAILQPALLIILGATVGVVVLSILLPLTDVSSFVST